MAIKRKNLVLAMTHNVRYLAEIHSKNSNLLKLTKEKLEAVEKWNRDLQDKNTSLNAKVDDL